MARYNYPMVPIGSQVPESPIMSQRVSTCPMSQTPMNQMVPMNHFFQQPQNYPQQNFQNSQCSQNQPLYSTPQFGNARFGSTPVMYSQLMPQHYPRYPSYQMASQSQIFPMHSYPSGNVQSTLRIGASLACPDKKNPREAKPKPPPTPEREPDIVAIENVVATFNVRTEVDPKKVCNTYGNCQYDKTKFAGCRMSLRTPHATVLIFRSGKLVSTGTKSVEQCRTAMRVVARRLQKMGYPVKFCETDLIIQNVVGTVTLGYKVDLVKLAEHTETVDYNPEVFSGAKCEVKDPKVTMNVFSNGKINIVGARSEEDVNKAYVEHKEFFRTCQRVAAIAE
ncbi:hypothetical protein L596_009758 [Steinernema carpocapsae]|uniref:TATA-box-binding protein n=1 Tax=Steinernema carpocapsae TaxID=34508 RepID=A0A4U5PGT4_STECR|nr:hypothetical protein L596_009758 [Steinernema carpocapsae]